MSEAGERFWIAWLELRGCPSYCRSLSLLIAEANNLFSNIEDGDIEDFDSRRRQLNEWEQRQDYRLVETGEVFYGNNDV